MTKTFALQVRFSFDAERRKWNFLYCEIQLETLLISGCSTLFNNLLLIEPFNSYTLSCWKVIAYPERVVDVIQTIPSLCTGRLKCFIIQILLASLIVDHHSSIELTIYGKENQFNNSRRVGRRRQSCKKPSPRSLLFPFSFRFTVCLILNSLV